MSSLILPNGSIVGSAGLSTAFHIENLIESQIIQTSKYEILLKLLVTDNFSDDDLKGLKHELKKRVEPLSINHKAVNFIKPGPMVKDIG